MQPTPSSSAADLRSFLRRSSGAFSALLVLPLAVVGCRDPKLTAYQVPKESSAALPASAPAHSSAETPAPVESPAMAPMATAPASAGPMTPAGAPPSHALQTATGASLGWTVPPTWQPKQGSAMRKATFAVSNEAGSAELAVTAFPGDVGGEIANVIRWRGQVGLPAIGDAEATASIERLEVNGLKIGIVDVAAPPAADSVRLLGAFVPYAGATWFFKLLGPDAVVAKAKPAFVEFLKTLKPAAGVTP